MDAILLVICAYFLHRMANDKGVSPWPYVLNYTGIFIMVVFVSTYAVSKYMNIDLSDFRNPETLQKLVFIQPFVILFEIMLFIFFRQRIKSLPDYNDEDDSNSHQDHTPPPPNKEKKDLSYFR